MMCSSHGAASDQAEANRIRFRDQHVVAIRLTGPRQAGKTTLIEATARALSPAFPIGVIAVDPGSGPDAVRLRAAGAVIMSVPALPLDAGAVHDALNACDSRELRVVFVEDVADAMSAAIVDVGQEVNVLALPVDDAAGALLQHSAMFDQVQLVLLTKADRTTTSDAMGRLRQRIAARMPRPAAIAVSARTGSGIDQWLRWVAGVGRPRSAPCALGVVGT